MMMRPRLLIILAIAIIVMTSASIAYYLQSGPAQGDSQLGIGGQVMSESSDQIGNNTLSQKSEQEKARLEEQSRIAEKLAADKTTAEQKPKYLRISFFLDSPLRGGISIPEEWGGRYWTSDNQRFFDLVYASSSGLTAKLLTIRLLNKAEWQEIKKDKKYKVLEEWPDLMFAVRVYEENIPSSSEAIQYQLMRLQLSEVIKSFKGQKQ